MKMKKVPQATVSILFFSFGFSLGVSGAETKTPPLPIGKPINETLPCVGGYYNSWIGLPVELLEKVNKGILRGKLEPMNRPGACYKVGPIAFNFYKKIGPQVQHSIGRISRRAAKIDGISVVTKKDQSPALLKVLGFDTMEAAYSAFPIRRDLNLADLHLVRFSSTGEGSIDYDRATPTLLGFARQEDEGNIEKHLSEGATWIDVRSPEEFAKGHHPKAKNIPYVKGDSNDIDPFMLIEKFQSRDRFPLKDLPSDLNAKLIFSGANIFDVRPIRALALAFNSGRTKITWYRSGEAGRTQVVEEVPAVWPGIGIVNPSAALSLKGAVYVDTRNSPSSVGTRGLRIPGAVPAPYRGLDSPTNLLWLNLQTLKEKKEAFPADRLPKDKSVPIVIYGHDKYDWAALKAAIWAKDSGWTKVFWLREGIASWRAMQDSDARSFKLEPLPASTSPN